MLVVANGVIFVNGKSLGFVSQLKNPIKDGTVINNDYPRPNKLVLG